MNFCKIFLVFFSTFLFCIGGQASGKILFVPMDNRPVCLAYTVDTLRAAGWDVVTPPTEYVASREHMGQPDKLLDWLEQESPSASAAVVSTDALLYGGLVASRTHHTDEDILSQRLQRLISIKDQALHLRLYAFSTIMRTPKASSGGVEPPYYEQYGPSIFRWSVLNDKANVLSLTAKEHEEKAALEKKIPAAYMEDWLQRRKTNLELNKKLVYAAIDNKFNYFVLGKDDTALFSQSHAEARQVEKIIQEERPWNFRMFVGADQLGLVLLTRAVNEMTHQLPFVNVHFANGVGPGTIPSYEDRAVGGTVTAHIHASGSFPVRSNRRADMMLFVNTPYDGVTKEASSPENIYEANETIVKFVAAIKEKEDLLPVAVADVQFGNGASNALAMRMMENNLGRSVASYAGWNTASNSIGYALGQGLLSRYMDKEDQSKMLIIRFTDDWVYQANVRNQLYSEIVWPRGINGTQLDNDKDMLEQVALQKIKAFYGGNVNKQTLDQMQVSFPWNRLFEVYVEIK